MSTDTSKRAFVSTKIGGPPHNKAKQYTIMTATGVTVECRSGVCKAQDGTEVRLYDGGDCEAYANSVVQMHGGVCEAHNGSIVYLFGGTCYPDDGSTVHWYGGGYHEIGDATIIDHRKEAADA